MDEFDISELSARARVILREDQGEVSTRPEPESEIDLLLNAFSKREAWIIDKLMHMHRRAKSALSLAEHAVETQLSDPAIKTIAGRALADTRSDVERYWSEITTRVHQSRRCQREYNASIQRLRGAQSRAQELEKGGFWQRRKGQSGLIAALKDVAKAQEEALLLRQKILTMFDEIIQIHDQMERVVHEFVRLMDQVLKPYRVTLHTLMPTPVGEIPANMLENQSAEQSVYS